MDKNDEAFYDQVVRKTHRRVEAGAQDESALWLPVPTGLNPVEKSLKNLVRQGRLVIHNGKMLMASYRGWTRNGQSRPSLKPLTPEDVVVVVLRNTVQINGVLSRFSEPYVANEMAVAKAIVRRLRDAGFINPPTA